MPPRRSFATIAPRRPSDFSIAQNFPRRGRSGAEGWGDTGVCIGMGVDPGLAELFVRLWDSRLLVASTVRGELVGRIRSRNVPADQQSAARVMLTALDRSSKVQIVQPTFADFSQIEEVQRQLAGAPASGGGHQPSAPAGEATSIVLAIQRAKATGVEQILLANDGGASRAAAVNGLATRHIGDLLAEFVCAGELTDDEAFDFFNRAQQMTGVPSNARPRAIGDFECGRQQAQCLGCERAEAAW
jgi:hypothetical protein